MELLGEMVIGVLVMVGGGLFVLSVLLEWVFNASLSDVLNNRWGARILKYIVFALGLYAVAAVLLDG